MEKSDTGYDIAGDGLQRSISNHVTAYGLDRYSYQQGANAQFGFQIAKNQEPALVAKGGSGLLLYQKEIGSLCATDFKGVRNQMVQENKLIICKR